MSDHRVHVPPGWREVDERPEGVLALLRSETASAVLTREPEPLRCADLSRWSTAARHGLAARFGRLQVIDVEAVELAGHRARRLLAHYPAAPVGGHVLEQWLVPDDAGGLVLSCTAPALAYDDALAAVFARIADTVPGAAT